MFYSYVTFETILKTTLSIITLDCVYIVNRKLANFLLLYIFFILCYQSHITFKYKLFFKVNIETNYSYENDLFKL